MFIFYRYVIRELVAPFVFAFCVIMFVLILKLMLDIMDLLISKGIPPLVMAKLFVYNLAWMIALVVPMSMLVATVMAFGRMGASGEIIAMKAAGISMYRIVAPVLFISVLLTIGMIWFNNEVLPEANYRARNLNAAIMFYKPTFRLQNRESQFVSDIPTVTVRVDSIDYATEELRGVALFRSTRGVYEDVIVAEAGRFIANPDRSGLTLMLENGEIHHFDPNQPARYVRSDYRRFFQNFTMDLRLDTDYKTSRNDRTKSVEMLENDIARMEAENRGLQAELNRLPAAIPDRDWQMSRIKNNIHSNNRQIAANLVEVHKKYSIPFASIVFVLLGSSLGILVRRSGASIGIGLSIGFFTLYYIALIGGESAGDRMLISPWLGMWSPNIVLGALGVCMMIYAARK